jgi:hypothetical protein
VGSPPSPGLRRRISPNASKVYPISQKLQALLSQRTELKQLAQRAFVNYVRSVQLQANKEIFDAKARAAATAAPAAARARA